MQSECISSLATAGTSVHPSPFSVRNEDIRANTLETAED